MRFLVDESTGASVARMLRELGHDVVEVASLMLGADDQEILSFALAEGRIILTNDKDFGEMIFRSSKPHRGLVLFRLTDESAANRVALARMVVTNYGDRLPDAFTVVTERGVRIRKG